MLSIMWNECLGIVHILCQQLKGMGGEGGMENLTKADMKIMGRVGGGVTKLR